MKWPLSDESHIDEIHVFLYINAVVPSSVTNMSHSYIASPSVLSFREFHPLDNEVERVTRHRAEVYSHNHIKGKEKRETTHVRRPSFSSVYMDGLNRLGLPLLFLHTYT